MVVELQDKLHKPNVHWHTVSQDVIDALKTLGLKANEIKELVSQIPSDIKTDEEKIKFVLSLKNK